MNFGFLSELNVWSVLVRLALAMVLGGAIGYERGRHGRAAGLRTHVLVSVGAAMAAMTGIFVVSGIEMGDPTRIASGVVSGIGFLGAGMILVKNQSHVTGLTTAAALWATSTVGIAIGAGFYVGGIIGAVLVFITTSVLTVFEVRQKQDYRFYVETDSSAELQNVLFSLHRTFPAGHDFDIMPAKTGLSGNVGIALNIDIGRETVDAVVDRLLTLPHIVIAIET